MVFTGENIHTSDSKGRVSVPSGVRTALKKTYDVEELVVTPSLTGECLWAFPPSELKRIADRMKEMGLSRANLARVRRRLFAKGHNCVIDKAGRINIPDSLRDMVGLGKEVLFAGVGAHIELWDPTAYSAIDSEFSDEEILGLTEFNL